MKMIKLVMIVTALVAAGSVAADNKSGHGSAHKSQHKSEHRSADKFSARLSGAQEVPPVVTDTRGRFELSYDEFEGTATFRIRLDEAFRVFMAHIHCAPAGSNGPIALWLAGRPVGSTGAWDVDGKWVDNTTVTDADVIPTECGATLAELVDAMRMGNTYVNVHSQSAPGGEVRGQVEEK